MNQNKIYVGSLSYEATAEDLESFFAQYGDIAEVKLIMDRETGRSRGFAFVTFNSDDAAKASLESDGSDIKGRKIRVNIAREGGAGGGRGGRGGRSGGGRGDYGRRD